MSSNPVLKEEVFRTAANSSGTVGSTPPPHLVDHNSPGIPDKNAMSLNGVLVKSGILAILLAFTFTFSWNQVMDSVDTGTGTAGVGWIFLGGVGAFIVSIILSFKPIAAPVLAPIFALLEGLVLGAISAFFETSYPGIVIQAALGTIGVFVSMLLLYRTGLIKVTSRFRSIVTLMMFGVVMIYLLSFIMSLFGTQIPYIHGSGPIGIGFSLLVLGIAASRLLVDFDTVESGIAVGAPKYMEWYASFALMVTLVWIYLETLRLLAKLRSR